MQIRETIERWVQDATERLRHDPANAAKQARIVERFLGDAGIREESELHPSKLTAWLRERAEGRARCTVRNDLSAVRMWSRWLASEGILKRPPFDAVKVARCDDTDGCDAITPEQAEALLAIPRAELKHERWQVRDNAGARLVAYTLMLEIGLRRGEVAAQRWDDVDLEARTLRVTRDKARRKDVIPLTRRATAVLRWWRWRSLHEGKLVDRVVPAGPNAKKARADLDRVGCTGEAGRFHRLRKAAITRRAKAGADVWTLTRWARHRDPKTTMRYVRHQVDDLREADR